MKERIDVTEKRREIEAQAKRIEVLGDIYNNIVDKMRWDILQYHKADDDNEDPWWDEYTEDDGWCYENMISKMPVYEEALNAIEKLMK